MAIEHLTFTIGCFDIQVPETNEFVLFEHPWTCKSWKMDLANGAMERRGLGIYYCDQCFVAATEHTEGMGRQA